MRTDLSIVITAHNEGLIAHKTMRSVQAAIDELEKKSVSYEVIISVDNGDADTLAYFARYASKKHYRVLEVSFRDLSASRNNAAVNAKGEFIAFLDADDLVSKEWYLKGYLLARKYKKDVIVHPEVSITFGDDHLAWKKRDSGNATHDTLCFVDNNLWDSPCLARRSVFLQHPYHPNGQGLGFEDKQFNSQTFAAGIAHKVAPQTVLFVRRKVSGSMLMQATTDRVTMAPSDLLSFESISKLDITPYLQQPIYQPPTATRRLLSYTTQKARHVAKKVHTHGKKYELYRKAMHPLREKRQAAILEALMERYPARLVTAWREAHIIDNQLFPAKALLRGLWWYNAENITPGVRYTQLVQSLQQKPDTLFFVPHIIKGGADKLFINYSAELAATHKDWHIAMLQTEAKTSVWRDKISPAVEFIDLYKLFADLDRDTQYRLLATFITQNHIKRIIIGNSQLAYDFVSIHQTLIKKLDIAVYCFAFGEEFDEEGRLWGHIHTGIPRIYPVIHRIITDNTNTVNKLEHEYAFDRNRFAVHYQPTDVTVQSPAEHSHTPLKVLWASRVCKQKRPDILKAVSRKLDPSLYSITAYGQLEEGLTADYFADSQVKYKGAFNGMNNLPTNEYDIFLYTSEGDGVPNILQEITASGLPIVASNVGGIREFIMTNKTGYLIEDHNDIDAYVAAITTLADAKLRKKLVKGAQKLLATQFSHNTWHEAIARDFDK
ncbi:MAG: glycosyltransferase [Candidatus Saccharibacteria bacterium]|nr:glycosyltransferase [Candidatus Saccharibacteria bacterium]